MRLIIILWVIMIWMAKPNTDAICGMTCPKCHANPGCMKDFSHFGQSKHWCMNCANTWGP